MAICLIALGVTILDFAADSCDSPLRAYIIDTCNSEDNNTGFNVHAFLGGSGAALGYLITSIDWENSLLADYIDIDESTLMSIIVTLVFVLSIVSTMVASKEKQIIIAKGELRGRHNGFEYEIKVFLLIIFYLCEFKKRNYSKKFIPRNKRFAHFLNKGRI